MSKAGLDPPYGDLVTVTRPASEFHPTHVCAAYMFFDGLQMKARHGYLPIAGGDPDAIAKDLLQAIGSNNYGNLRPEIRDRFALFGFNSQQKVYLFVDNNPDVIGFDPDAPLENVIRFTQFSGVAPNRPRRMNYAFAGIRKLDFTTIAGGTLGWDRNCNLGYGLDFWNTDDNGRPITGVTREDPFTHYLYSMNIHLRMVTGSLPLPPNAPVPPLPEPDVLRFVPIIVDPDTGNMGGTP